MYRSVRRAPLATLIAALGCAAAFTAPALAIVPEDAVTGTTNSNNWFSGSLIQQPGLNCSTAILGESYTEIMVSGIAAYGGAPGGGIPKVGDGYWTSFLISVPGNPCGPGSSSIQTELVLPPNTAVDSARPIRCFGVPRDQTAFVELTGQSWSAFGSSGSYCPTAPGPAVYNQGALSFGFRPIASGQLFQVFVPVKSTATLVGISTTPADGFRWLTNSTGVYANPGLSTVWATVLPGGSPAGPFVYFTGPAAIPFWKVDKPGDPVTPEAQKNRVEFFANLSTSGLEGSFCFGIDRLDKLPSQVTDCAFAKLNGGWNDVVPAGGSGLFKVQATGSALGPNGGYAPFAFDKPTIPSDPLTGEWDVPMRITWTFDPTGAPPPVSKSADFRTLAGPDTDGDGVADISDACPSVKGTLNNGCLPTPEADPDKDGVYGAADLCPTAGGAGAPNGCPGGVVPLATPSGQPPGALPASPTLSGALGLKRGAVLRRALLGKGLAVSLSCTRDASAALDLTVARRVAKALRLKPTGATVRLATGRGACRAVGGASVKLRLGKAVRRAVQRSKGRVSATLTLRLTAPDSSAATASLPVKLG